MPNPRPSLSRFLVTLALGAGLTSVVDAQVQIRPLAKKPLPTDRNPSFNVAAGDVDGDGDVDLVFANTRDQSRLYLNDGFGNFTDATSANLPLVRLGTVHVALVDVDGDKDLDLVLANLVWGSTAQTRLYKNDGKGKFTDVTSGNMPNDADNTYDLFVGDVDGDKDPDILLANFGSQNKLYVNDGKGKFTDVTSARLPTRTELTAYVSMTDVDGDQDLDILFANYGVQNRLLINDRATNKFKDETSTRLPMDTLTSFGVHSADFDGDGDQDVVFANYRARNSLYINNGKGVFTDLSSRLPNTVARSYRLEPVDLDDDNDLDLVVVNYSGQSRYLENDGSGNFTDRTSPRFLQFTANSTGLAIGDFDCDGDNDLAFANWGSQNQVWFNLHRQVYAEVDAVIGQNYVLDFYSMPGYATLPQVLFPGINILPMNPKILIPPWGYLGVQATGMILLPGMTISIPGGKTSVTIPIPNQAALRGIKIYTQALAAQLPRVPRFTNTNVDTIK